MIILISMDKLDEIAKKREIAVLGCAKRVFCGNSVWTEKSVRWTKIVLFQDGVARRAAMRDYEMCEMQVAARCESGSGGRERNGAAACAAAG